MAQIWEDLHKDIVHRLNQLHSSRQIQGLTRTHRAPNPPPPPAKFDHHLRKDLQLRHIKWAPDLAELGMQKLKDLYAPETPVSVKDPGYDFWRGSDVKLATRRLRSKPPVASETSIQRFSYGILDSLVNIASQILFHLNSDESTADAGFLHHDLAVYTYNHTHLLCNSDIKLSEDPKTKAGNQLFPILVERIIYVMEYKNPTVTPSSFFFRMCCRAASRETMFEYKSCSASTTCKHPAVRTPPLPTDSSLTENLYVEPKFDPTPEELAKLLSNARLRDGDLSDETGCLSENPDIDELSQHPRMRVARAILRTGSTPLDMIGLPVSEEGHAEKVDGYLFEKHLADILQQVRGNASPPQNITD